MSLLISSVSMGSSRRFPAVLALRSIVLVTAIGAPSLFGKTVFQTTDFESFTTGAGNLTPAFTTLAFGPSSLSSPIVSNDPIQGVVSSSVIGTGKAGYLGGGGTAIDLDASPGILAAEIFNGTPAANAFSTVQLAGSVTPVISFALDFAIHRVSPDNIQSFSINYYDAQFADGSGFATHSKFEIDASNEVFIQDNQNSGFIDTGLSLASDRAYHLALTVDYNSAHWSALLSDASHNYLLASNRAINVSGYTLSGFTTPTNAIANINLLADSVDAGNSALNDRLVFDNLETSALSSLSPVPEPSTYGLMGALGVGLIVALRKKRDRNAPAGH
jgi:PEP-CTERM motif